MTSPLPPNADAPAVRQLIETFPVAHAELQDMLRLHPRAVDLLDPDRGGNPGLVASLALAIQHVAAHSERTRLALLLAAPRREIARALDIPSGEASLRVLARIPPEHCAPLVLKGVTLALRDPLLRRRLARLPVVTAVAALAASHHGLLALCTDSLLCETAEWPQMPAWRFVRELARHVEALRREGACRPVQSVAEVRARAGRGTRFMGDGVIPPAPLDPAIVAGVLTPITSATALKEAAEVMQNCAYDYLSEITVLHTRYMYWVEGDPRGLAMIGLRHGQWCILQVRGPRNTPLAPERVQALHELVARANPEPVPPSPTTSASNGAVHTPRPLRTGGRDVPRSLTGGAAWARPQSSWPLLRPLMQESDPASPPPCGIARLDAALRFRAAERQPHVVIGDLRQARAFGFHWALHTLFTRAIGVLVVETDRFVTEVPSRVISWLVGVAPEYIPYDLDDNEQRVLRSAQERLARLVVHEVATPDAKAAVLRTFGHEPLVWVAFEDPDAPLPVERQQWLAQVAHEPWRSVFLSSWSAEVQAPPAGGEARAGLSVPWALRVLQRTLDADTGRCETVNLALVEAEGTIRERAVARRDGGGCFTEFGG